MCHVHTEIPVKFPTSKLSNYVLKLPCVLFLSVKKLNIGLIPFVISFDYYLARYLIKAVNYDLNIPNQNWSILKHKQIERKFIVYFWVLTNYMQFSDIRQQWGP